MGGGRNSAAWRGARRCSLAFRLASLALLSAALGGCEDGQLPERCVDSCTLEDSFCGGSGELVRCEIDALGCRSWSPPRSCGAHQLCLAGACSCRNPCTPGQAICDGGGGRRRCVGPDAAGCSHWGDVEPCAAGVGCSGGACGCDTPCTAEELACDLDGRPLRCRAAEGAEGCASWQPEAACTASMACVAGACTCRDPCQTGHVECDGAGGLRACGGADEHRCALWGGATPCPEGLVCKPTEGGCRPDTPVACYERNECSFIGQKLCMTSTAYRACRAADNGCLEWDCST